VLSHLAQLPDCPETNQPEQRRRKPERGVFMLRKWLEEDYKALSVLLLVLAALNGWIAYAILHEHPVMALANAAMAVVIVLGVIICRRAGGAG
jgi:hypothetical protein